MNKQIEEAKKELKQIDEIAKLICTYPQCSNYMIIGGCKIAECYTVDIAKNLYKQGYTKQECCKTINVGHCKECPYKPNDNGIFFGCCNQLMADALSLIQEQKTVPQILEEIKLMLSIHFGTYTDKDTIKISDVFKLIDNIGEQFNKNEINNTI